MNVQSMTGFARASRERAGLLLVWELRSVNGKALEVRLRLPPRLEGIEASARQAFGRRFGRGNIQAVLSAAETGRAFAGPMVNEALLEGFAALARRLTEQFGAAPASADGLLALPGVLSAPEAAGTAQAGADEERFAVDLLEEALSGLETARVAEGEALCGIVGRHLDLIESLALRAEADPSREPAAIRERLAAQVRLLLGASVGLDEGRLYAEAALLAVRADIREEIDCLKLHCAAARALLLEGGPVGRRLEFLGQELNREANTLCSKSVAPAVSAAGLELKAAVDRFREQALNLE